MPSEGERGRYHRYKAATNAVFEWLHRATKPKTKNAKRKAKKHGARSADVAEWSVSQIYAAALEVVDAALPVPAAILRKLGTAIHLRHQYSLKMSPDDGHTHVLNTLRAIEVQWTPLVPIKSSLPVDAASVDAASINVNLANAFEALATDDVDNDTDVRAETPMTPFDMTTFVAPVDTVDAARAALQARIEDEKFQCTCFLLDLDDMNREVMRTWELFKVFEMSLLAATAATNACVHAVQVLSNDLSFAYPHLKDLDHILALLVCEDLLIGLVSDYDGLTLGTAVELVVVAKRATVEQLRPAAERTIAKALKTTAAVASRLIDDVHTQFLHEAKLAGLHWTSTLGIEGSIASLQHMLHSFHEAMTSRRRMVGHGECGGRNWAEPHELALSPSDLYETFFANILPALVAAVRNHAVVKLNHEAEIRPLLVLLEASITTKDVPIALIFACQSLLWSLFFTQGKAEDWINCTKVVESTRDTIKRMMEEMIRALENADGLFVPPTTETNVKTVLGWFFDLHILTSPSKVFSQMDVDRAWFNPYMAGQTLLMITMEISFAMGLITVDDIGQTRMVLHLYNALRILDKIPANEDLDNLVSMFERGKSVWVGGRPMARGGFVKAHLLAWGYNSSTAATMAASARRDKEAFLAKVAHCDRVDHRSAAQKKSFKASDISRQLQRTEPGAVSKAYRYVTRTMLPADVDATRLPRALDIKDIIQSDYNAFLYLDLNTVGQLFRTAWKDMIATFGFIGLKPATERGSIDGLGRVTDANIRHERENLFFQKILALCDVNPDHSRVTNVAASLEELAQEMHTTYTSYM